MTATGPQPALAATQRPQPSVTPPQAVTSQRHGQAITYQSQVFQQVKQTQASLARLSRSHHNQQQLNSSQPQHSVHHQLQTAAACTATTNVVHSNSQHQHQHQHQQQQQQQQQSGKSATFVDCLIRRFKDCFSEDFCIVPMFVVGNLSPGLDGSNLILPPTVSLNGQHIARFSSPKNLRVMTSIRDSCRSIEELDLGANKLTDLIEVYKILQCTPNLRFLNLSENDLSRTSPVAVATAQLASVGGSPSVSQSTIGQSQQHHNQHHNQQQTAETSLPLGALTQNAARHLQPTAASRARETGARRLAAAAFAQSKKTSARSAASSVAAAVGGIESADAGCDAAGVHHQKAPTAKGSAPVPMSRAPSTLHLARSLSSLSAKDLAISKQRTSTVTGTQKSLHGVPNSTSVNIRSNSRRCLLSRSGTTLTSSSTGCGPFRRTFDSIKALALNNTHCQWKTVCSILSRMPNLEELHLSLNDYQRIDLEPVGFQHQTLKRLYLCNNPKLTNWRELDKLLAAFPSLEALSMADCAISQIPENLGGAREWRKLCGLNINGWPIKEWPVVERLNQLPSLVDLKCRNLDVLSSIDEPRAHLIARLPKLQRLNGSEIEEREFAEKEFLRFFIANSHLERPSRFEELAKIHGLDALAPPALVDVDVDLSPPNTANVRVVYLNRAHCEDLLMSVDFLATLVPSSVACHPHQQQQLDQQLVTPDENHFEDNEKKLVRLFKDESREVLALSVDLRQSVRKFKADLRALLGLVGVSSSNDLILYYIDREMVGLMGPELMKHNQKKLWNYNVQDGDQFIVEKR